MLLCCTLEFQLEDTVRLFGTLIFIWHYTFSKCEPCILINLIGLMSFWSTFGTYRSYQQIQSRPIEMRATILYLVNCWTVFEMLLTPLRFLYLVMFSLLAFPSIPQFIAHFWQISSFLCIVLPFSNSYRNESCSKACSAHFANAATLFFSLLLKEQNGGAKKGLKSQNKRD